MTATTVSAVARREGGRGVSWRAQLGSARNRYVRLIAEGSELDRTIAFSDAVFAIAMTILVLELHIPDVPAAQLPSELQRLVPAYLTFVLSFMVVGVIWLSHHRKFGVMARFNQTLLRLNLLMLLMVASLALPTAVLGRYGDQPIAVVLYAAFVSAIGLLMSAMWGYAWRRHLIEQSVDRGVFRFVLIQSLIIPVTFLLSIPIAVTAGANPAEYSWLLAFLLLLGLRSLTRTGRRSAGPTGKPASPRADEAPARPPHKETPPTTGRSLP
jgi:uncharacterized membrane protein